MDSEWVWQFPIFYFHLYLFLASALLVCLSSNLLPQLYLENFFEYIISVFLMLICAQSELPVELASFLAFYLLICAVDGFLGLGFASLSDRSIQVFLFSCRACLKIWIFFIG